MVSLFGDSFLTTSYSMKKKHIYTLPEEFIKDSAVPARWKVLSLLQGFWFSGLTFYGTNEWLKKELGYSERHIQKALGELEELGLITRNVKGFKRLIFPGGCYQGSPQGATRGREEHATRGRENAERNADSIKGEQSSHLEYEIVPDVDEKPPKKKPGIDKVFAMFGGRRSIKWKKDTTQRKHAEILYDTYGEEQIKKALDYYNENKDEPFCPQITSPWELNLKWDKLLAYKKKNGD